MNTETITFDNTERNLTTIKLTEYEKVLLKKYFGNVQTALDDILLECLEKEQSLKNRGGNE